MDLDRERRQHLAKRLRLESPLPVFLLVLERRIIHHYLDNRRSLQPVFLEVQLPPLAKPHQQLNRLVLK